jgi:hypothetical protein
MLLHPQSALVDVYHIYHFDGTRLEVPVGKHCNPPCVVLHLRQQLQCFNIQITSIILVIH